MILNGYGVSLSSITEDKIEKVRKWRNHPDIANLMRNKQLITTVQQKKWFNSLKAKETCLYLLINYKSEDIGMIYAQSISTNDMLSKKPQPLNIALTISPGLYIAPDCKYKNTVLAFCPSLVFIDYLFKQGLCIELQAQVYESNESAIRYNKALGYKLGNVDEQGLLTMTLNVNDFESAKKELSKILRF